jgi:hypothetical protein
VLSCANSRTKEKLCTISSEQSVLALTIKKFVRRERLCHQCNQAQLKKELTGPIEDGHIQ